MFWMLQSCHSSKLPVALFSQFCMQGEDRQIFTLLCVHLLVVCICCTSILGFHPIPFINIFSWLSFPLTSYFKFIFIFNLFQHLYFFFRTSCSLFHCLLELFPSQHSSVKSPCLNNNVPFKLFKEIFFAPSSTDIGSPCLKL